MTRPRSAALCDPTTLLAAWEAAATAPHLARGAAVLRAAGLGGAGDPLDLGLGELTRLAARCLLDTFGERQDCVLGCPDCGRLLELEVPIGVAGDERSIGRPEPAMTAARAGQRFDVRAPTTRDVLAAAGQPDPRAVLVRRCASRADGEPVVPEDLSAEQWQSLVEGFERVSGTALPVLRAACPECGAPVEAVLDVPALLAERVSLAGPALLRDVATLAAAFGWTEHDVLALPPGRRSAYLDLVRP